MEMQYMYVAMPSYCNFSISMRIVRSWTNEQSTQKRPLTWRWISPYSRAYQRWIKLDFHIKFHMLEFSRPVTDTIFPFFAFKYLCYRKVGNCRCILISYEHSVCEDKCDTFWMFEILCAPWPLNMWVALLLIFQTFEQSTKQHSCQHQYFEAVFTLNELWSGSSTIRLIKA